ncbi:unnamed protein product [Rhizophagus irregularis]|uniref:Uncharacterized protein n=1 Tax=Rhizophagus irregularis TaxID=588596 RepID=A0A915ZFW9_9GLOM|nr:unnamed protein product [Rhizophagus irregularis]CAB5375040.1 unnamed protein product [Rhizophagus irregularis]
MPTRQKRKKTAISSKKRSDNGKVLCRLEFMWHFLMTVYYIYRIKDRLAQLSTPTPKLNWEKSLILDAVWDSSEASSSSIYTDIEQEEPTDSIPLSSADMKSYREAAI